jgi:hypothetical protein
MLFFHRAVFPLATNKRNAWTKVKYYRLKNKFFYGKL